MTPSDTVRTTTQPLFGGYAQLHYRMRAIGTTINSAIGILVLAGYASLFGGANWVGWAINIGCLAAVGVMCAVTFTLLHRTYQRNLIDFLDGAVQPTPEALDKARREILLMPWVSAYVTVAAWTLTGFIITAAFEAAQIFPNAPFKPFLAGLAVVPAAACITLFGANFACEPYRTALFTGADVRNYPSKAFLTVERRFLVCMVFAAYLLVLLAICVAASDIASNSADIKQQLLNFIIPIIIISLSVLATMCWIALRPEPLERQSFTDPTAVDALQAAYTIESEIGRGGMGIIYKARHKLLNRLVAIKMLNPNLIGNRDAVMRFGREARSTSALHHPNILSIIDFGVLAGGRCFIVMEFLEGETLADKIKRDGNLSEQEALPIFISIAEGLAHAHSNGVLHRDLKPSNVMLCKDGAVKVVDFGIAKMSTDPLEPENLTRTGQVFGTPAYMSPEQAFGKELDQRADVYSMGCLMFEALMGKQVFSGTTPLHILMHQTSDEVAELPESCGVSAALREAVNHAMVKNIDKRIQSMNDLATRLRAICETMTSDLEKAQVNGQASIS